MPTDFGSSSDEALDYAVDLAKAIGADIVIMHAYELPIVGFPDGALVATADVAARVLEGAQIGLKKTLDRIEGCGVAVRGVVKQGEPWRAILDAVDEAGAHMIVMGTHGRRGLPRALLGSVAEKVVRTATVPVTTIHAREAARAA
ncbi:MAG: universal stress protein [Labilithrix sp.]|nr:universal stress protein [Labilithrix sp.]